MNKEILIDKKEEKKKRVAINQLRNAEDNAGAKREKKIRKKEKHLERKIESLEKYYIHRKKKEVE
jgi:hypothetical protein